MDSFGRKGGAIRSKVESRGEVRTDGTDETLADEFGSNWPGPKGFPLAGARCVRRLARCTTSTFAAFLVDRLAKRQTE
jgi:hypothetical protein